MKIIICPDKFKDTFTASEISEIIADAVKNALPNAECKLFPLSDGGEGFCDTLLRVTSGEKVYCTITDPLFRKIQTYWVLSGDKSTAYIEIAKSSGLQLLAVNERNAMHTTSLGVGELIKDAINYKVKKIVLGLGGSATNDCGTGMASALGFRFFNNQNREIIPCGKSLSDIYSLQLPQNIDSFKDIQFIAATDVTNILFGEQGAAYVFAAQKGCNHNEIKLLDAGLENIGRILENRFKKNIVNMPGAGAAGGLGAGCLAFLNAEIKSGIEYILQQTNAEHEFSSAGLIITGEGQIDWQTFQGKTISGVLKLAGKYQIPVWAIGGLAKITHDKQIFSGNLKIFSLFDQTIDLQTAKQQTPQKMYDLFQNLFKNKTNLL